MNANEKSSMAAWVRHTMDMQRLTFHRVAEGWLADLDGFPMSYGETREAAAGWAFIMSHKSAYE